MVVLAEVSNYMKNHCGKSLDNATLIRHNILYLFIKEINFSSSSKACQFPFDYIFCRDLTCLSLGLYHYCRFVSPLSSFAKKRA